MKILLDTPEMRENFLDLNNQLFFSIAGLWEITIKISLGKLELADKWLDSVQHELNVNNIHWLPIEVPHCAILETLPFIHTDPFDRMLIAQAMTEKWPS